MWVIESPSRSFSAVCPRMKTVPFSVVLLVVSRMLLPSGMRPSQHSSETWRRVRPWNSHAPIPCRRAQSSRSRSARGRGCAVQHVRVSAHRGRKCNFLHDRQEIPKDVVGERIMKLRNCRARDHLRRNQIRVRQSKRQPLPQLVGAGNLRLRPLRLRAYARGVIRLAQRRQKVGRDCRQPRRECRKLLG